MNGWTGTFINLISTSRAILIILRWESAQVLQTSKARNA